MIKYLKRFCRWVLREELNDLNRKLESEKELSFRLATRLKPYNPEMIGDGVTDNSDIVDFNMDVSMGLREPFSIGTGVFKTSKPIIIRHDIDIVVENECNK